MKIMFYCVHFSNMAISPQNNGEKKRRVFYTSNLYGFDRYVDQRWHSSEAMAESCGRLQKSRAARKECKAEGDLKGAW